MERQLQTLRGHPLVSGFSTDCCSTATCQAFNECPQLVETRCIYWLGRIQCLAIRYVSLHDLLRYEWCIRASVLTMCTPFSIHNSNNDGNFYSAGILHVVALMTLLYYCVHQTHVKHHAKTIQLMLIKRQSRLKNIITIPYSSNKNGDIIISVK